MGFNHAVLWAFAPVALQLGRAAGSAPHIQGFSLVHTYDHDPLAFTQGLLWVNGSLYESTGLYKRSSVREIRLEGTGSATIARSVSLQPEHFGEGLARVGDYLIQLLWKRNDVLWYRVRAGEGGHLELDHTVSNAMQTPLKDGWGLVYDGKNLLATDSSSKIYHLDPSSLELVKVVDVVDGGRSVEMVNELEYFDGALWANIYGTDCIARIDPESGRVLGWIDFGGLLDKKQAALDASAAGRPPPDVFNGIAWDPWRRRLFVTGKFWPHLFEVEIRQLFVTGKSWPHLLQVEIRQPKRNMTLERVRARCIPKRNLFS